MNIDTVQVWSLSKFDFKGVDALITKDYYVYFSLVHWKKSKLPTPAWVKEHFGDKKLATTTLTSSSSTSTGWVFVKDFEDSD